MRIIARREKYFGKYFYLVTSILETEDSLELTVEDIKKKIQDNRKNIKIIMSPSKDNHY